MALKMESAAQNDRNGVTDSINTEFYNEETVFNEDGSCVADT